MIKINSFNIRRTPVSLVAKPSIERHTVCIMFSVNSLICCDSSTIRNLILHSTVYTCSLFHPLLTNTRATPTHTHLYTSISLSSLYYTMTIVAFKFPANLSSSFSAKQQKWIVVCNSIVIIQNLSIGLVYWFPRISVESIMKRYLVCELIAGFKWEKKYKFDFLEDKSDFCFVYSRLLWRLCLFEK